jgi:hypothetical protein
MFTYTVTKFTLLHSTQLHFATLDDYQTPLWLLLSLLQLLIAATVMIVVVAVAAAVGAAVTMMVQRLDLLQMMPQAA